MLKRNLWKLVLSSVIVLWAVLSLTPLQDRNVPEFITSEVETKNEEFLKLLADAKARFEEKKAPSVFVALRDLANERRIDLAREYFPGVKLESSLGNITKRNNILLDHLLLKSKGRLQLGLDLKGGVAFTLEVDEKAAAQIGARERAEKLDKAIEIIDERINGLGVAEPLVRPVGENRIEVQLPGVNTRDNPEVLDAVKKPARLDFRLVYPFSTPETSPNEIPPGYEIKTYEQELRNGQTVTNELFVKRTWEMTGQSVARAYATMDQVGRYQINLEFNSEGAKRFADVTREVAKQSQELIQRTGNQNARAQLAIVLDGRVYSAPGVENEISGGRAQITGQFTQREAIELANVLNNPLDLPLQVKEQYEVGPSLAQDAIDSGVRASVIGTVLVIAFMVTFYSVGGVVAIGSLAVNLLIIFGAMASIGATLTLPGLAGIVLTVGMAVDANILIFERMREELAVGKSLSAANNQGFIKALTTILDAHLVQLIICAIMIWKGQGPIKGFGVTLAIGVVSTLLSVLVTAHLIMELIIDKGLIKKLTMRHLLKHINVDFVRYGKPAFIASWGVVLLGLIVVFVKGERIYGIDFVGGDVVNIQFTQRLDTADIRKVANAAGLGEVTPTYVSALGGGREVLRVETATDKGDPLFVALKEKYPDAGLENIGSSHIGASIGGEIKRNAVLAVGLSMLAILIYIAFRFEVGFGMGAMVSSLHDILMTIGIFVLFGHHFSAPMVAAILAIAGYSINETVVVFDRIREELKENPGGSLKDIVNAAINKVFARTIMTASTTFLAALALFLFGGGVLRDISFTFLVGIVTSTFSAIFVSAQIFYWWHKGDRKKVDHEEERKVYDWEVGGKISGAKTVGPDVQK